MREDYIDFSNCFSYSAKDFREIMDEMEKLIIEFMQYIPYEEDGPKIKDIGNALSELQSFKSLARDKRDEEGRP